MFVGADAEALEALAKRVDGWRNQVSGAVPAVDSGMHQQVWRGAAADRFRHDWQAKGRKNLDRTAELLAAIAKRLREEADGQRKTSASGGDFLARVPGMHHVDAMTQEERNRWYRHAEGTGLSDAEKRQWPGLEWADKNGEDTLRDLQGMTPEERARRWGELTEQQRDAMLLTYPGALVGMDGIPDADRATARLNWLAQERATISDHSETSRVKAEVKALPWSLGAEGSAAIDTTMAGNATVTFKLEGDIGKEFKAKDGAEAGIEAGASVSREYKFNTEAEAKEFTEKVQAAIKRGDLAEAKRLLDAQPHEGTIFGVHVGAHAKFEAGPVELNVSGKAEATYNTATHEKTVSLSVEGSAGLGGVEVGAGTKLKMTFDEHNQAKTASITIDAHVTGEAELKALLASVDPTGKATEIANAASSIKGGAEVSLTANLDVQNPEVQRLLGDLSSGHPSPDTLRRLLALSSAEATVSTTTSSTDSGGATVLGRGVTYETGHDTSTTKIAFAKAPNTGFERITR